MLRSRNGRSANFDKKNVEIMRQIVGGRGMRCQRVSPEMTARTPRQRSVFQSALYVARPDAIGQKGVCHGEKAFNRYLRKTRSPNASFAGSRSGESFSPLHAPALAGDVLIAWLRAMNGSPRISRCLNLFLSYPRPSRNFLNLISESLVWFISQS